MTPLQEHKMEQAVQLFNNNCDVRTITQINNIMYSLKEFISLNKSLYKDFDGEIDSIHPRVYSFIALCNYKMCNYDRAYWCAQKSIELGEELMKNSALISSVNFYLDQQVFALVDDLKNRFSDEIDFGRGYSEGEENIFDDSRVLEIIALMNGNKPITPPANQIKGLIEALSKIQENASNYYETKGDGLQAFQYNQMVDMFKLPLYCAWQLYKYGWHTDFLEEGDSLFPYMMFETKAQDMIKDLINILKTESPFALLEKNNAITNGLLSVYSTMLNDFETGKIEIK